MVSGTYYVRAYATNSIGTAYGNEVSFTIVSLNIGDSYQGGKVAYLDATGQHGLIVSNSDLGSYNWSNAISICQNYSVIEDGVTYDDWYLPNKGELNLLRNIKGILGNDFSVLLVLNGGESQLCLGAKLCFREAKRGRNKRARRCPCNQGFLK